MISIVVSVIYSRDTEHRVENHIKISKELENETLRRYHCLEFPRGAVALGVEHDARRAAAGDISKWIGQLETPGS